MPTRERPKAGASRVSGQSGVALVELLLTVFILLIGMLGLAAIQLRVANANIESYQRAQALVLLEDMVERFNATRQLQTCFNITNATTGTPYLGQGVSASDANLLDVSSTSGFPCSSVGVTASDARARIELESWDLALKGSSETIGTAKVGGFVGARGCISSATGADGMLVYTFAVAWQGSDETVAPSNTCGLNTYDSEVKRRVVWTTVRVAGLL